MYGTNVSPPLILSSASVPVSLNVGTCALVSFTKYVAAESMNSLIDISSVIVSVSVPRICLLVVLYPIVSEACSSPTTLISGAVRFAPAHVVFDILSLPSFAASTVGPYLNPYTVLLSARPYALTSIGYVNEITSPLFHARLTLM